MAQGNSVQLVGRLGGDPDVKYFESGTVVANATLAVDRANGDKNPDWFDLEVWGKTAEVMANYCQKGKQIAIVGSIYLQHWQDRNTGANRSKPVVRVDQLTLLGGKQGGDSGSEYSEF